MLKAKVWEKKSTLLILLGFLCVAIVGLVIWLVVSSLNQGTLAKIDCANKETADDVNVCIGDFYNIYSDAEVAIDEYNNAIDNSERNGNYQKAADLIVDRSIFLVAQINDCKRALQLYNDENIEKFDANNKVIIYSGAVGNSIDCNNEEEKTKWENLLTDTMKYVEGGFSV